MMHMTLYWGREVTLLFDSWKTESWLSYSFTLLFCFLLPFFHQLLEAQRFKLKPVTPAPSSGPSVCSADAPLIHRRLSQTRWIRIAAAVLFGVNSAIAYVIMLTIMSYNGGVFVAVVFGLSIGYFLFRIGDSVDVEDVRVPAEDNAWACS